MRCCVICCTTARGSGKFATSESKDSGAFDDYNRTRTRTLAHTPTHRLFRSAADRRALLREAQLLRRLSHPNVLPILAVFTDGQCAFLETPYLPGGSLEQVLHPLEVNIVGEPQSF